MSTPSGSTGDALVGVDSAALVLAGLAAATSLITSEGDWTVTSTVLGIALATVVLAFHRPVPASDTWRHRLLRVAFGLVLALTLALALAWPVQELVVRPYFNTFDDRGNSLAAYDTTSAVAVGALVVGLVIAYVEPWIARRLDRPR